MNKLKGFIYGCISAATYGLIPLFALPVMAEGVAFDSLLCYRFAVASAAIACLMLIRRESFRVSARELVTLVALGGFFSLSSMFLFKSYHYMGAGVATTILFLYPLFVALLMALLFREKIGFRTCLAMVMALTGVALLYWGDGGVRLSLKGILFVLLSGLTYAFYIVVINKSNVREMSGPKLTFYAMLVTMAVFLVKVQFSGGVQPLPRGAAVANVLLLGLVPTVVSCVTMVSAVHYVGSTCTAVLGALDPVTAVAVGVLVFGEPFTRNLAVGICLIIAAVTVVILAGVQFPAGLRMLLARLRFRLPSHR